MHCPPHVMAPIVHPPKCCTQHYFQATVVPHIHPSHTTHVNHHLFQHQHYFPHTESVTNIAFFLVLVLVRSHGDVNPDETGTAMAVPVF